MTSLLKSHSARWSAFCALAGLTLALWAVPMTSQAERPPNFLVLMADDLSAKELSCYDHPVHKTPNLDALAASGMRFRTCFSTPLCSPTRMMLMTGRYGFRTGWMNLLDREGAPKRGTPQFDIGANEITFAEVLKPKGYATGLSGKWQLPGDFPKSLIYDCGFDEYFAWLPKVHLVNGALYEGPVKGIENEAFNTKSRYWNPIVVQDGKIVPTTDADYGPDMYTDYAIDFMTRHKDEPFLLYYPMALTHKPWDPTPDPTAPGGKTKGGIQANVEYLDQLIGRLVAALEKLGLRENTVFLFTGDNGTSKYGDMEFGKGSVTEMGARVPLIVSCPGIVQTGVVSDELVDLSDVLPTMAELAGAAPPAERVIDGRSFAHVLRGEPGESREWIFAYLRDKRLLRDKRWMLEGDGQFYDCGDSRDGSGYKNVTDSTDPEVVAARKRFEEILVDLPVPDIDFSKPKKSKSKTEDAE